VEVRAQNQDITESEVELQAFLDENIHTVRGQAR